MDMSRQVSTCSDKLRHVGNNTVQCSSVLVLEVVFDGLGQVQFGDFALLNALFINGLTYNGDTNPSGAEVQGQVRLGISW